MWGVDLSQKSTSIRRHHNSCVTRRTVGAKVCRFRAAGESHEAVELSGRDPFQSPGMMDSGLGGVPQQQKMLKGHIPRFIYHQVY